MIDDIIGEVGKGFLRIFGQIVGEVIFHTVLYYVGWPVLKLVSFGNYPKGLQQAGSLLSSCIGLVVILLTIITFYG